MKFTRALLESKDLYMWFSRKGLRAAPLKDWLCPQAPWPESQPGRKSPRTRLGSHYKGEAWAMHWGPHGHSL